MRIVGKTRGERMSFIMRLRGTKLEVKKFEVTKVDHDSAMSEV